MRKILKKLGVLIAVVALSATFVARGVNVSATVPGNVTLLSESSINSGQGGNNQSTEPYITKNGKYVMFLSRANDLVSGDTNGYFDDLFATDLSSNTTVRINVSTASVEANSASELMTVSETGRYVVFRSKAGNLIDGVANPPYAGWRTYIRDMAQSTTTEFVPLRNSTDQVMDISSDGRYILEGKALSLTRHDTLTSTSIGLVNGKNIFNPAMSCNGQFVVFNSTDSTITAGDTNGYSDVFLADFGGAKVDTDVRITSITQGGNGDSQKAILSCNGNYIGFRTFATNLGTGHVSSYGQYYSYNRIENTFSLLTQSTSGVVQNSDVHSDTRSSLSLSDKGDAVFSSVATNLVSGWSSGAVAMYFRNAEHNTTEILSIRSGGTPGSASFGKNGITSDGRLATGRAADGVLLTGEASGYLDVFLMETGIPAL